jgi:hypothetical protein
MTKAKSPVHGERDVTIRYRARDLLWRLAGRLVRLVAVRHATRESCLLMCADLTLDPIEVVCLYGLRFKIAPTFKRAMQLIGSFLHRFWMMDMKPLRRCNGNKHLYRKSLQYRQAVKRKIHGCHVFIRAGITAEGLLQHLAVSFPQLLWSAFRSRLRTIGPGIPPSERVVVRAAPESTGNSPPFSQKRFRDRIHPRATGSRENAAPPSRLMS